MNNFHHRFVVGFVVAVCLLTLTMAGCASVSRGASGEGGAGAIGGTGSALLVAEKVSVVDAQDESAAVLVAGLRIGSNLKKAVSTLPSDSDYNTDETHVFVEERSMEAFETINQILCMLDQTRYDDLVNLGDYLVQIDKSQCDAGNDDASAAGEESQNQSSGNNAPSFIFATVNSYRADGNSPHIVAVWLHMEGSDFEPPQLIKAKFSITEGVSEKNPLGIFHMDFEGSPEPFEDKFGISSSPPFFGGYLETERQSDDSIIARFYNSGGFEGDAGEKMSFDERVAMTRLPNGSGAGSMEATRNEPMNSDSGQQAFNIAYNDDFFLREDSSSGSQICFDRHQFETTTHRYSLYYNEDTDNPGGLVERDSGFPIRYTDGNGERRHGYVGYWGVWADGNEALADGTTVYRETFDGPEGEDNTTPLTLRIINGKLVHHTRQNVTLGEICGIPLNWGDCGMEGCIQYRVEWGCNNEGLNKTGRMNEESHLWEDMDPEEVTFGDNDWTFNFWSESLGGDGRINLRDPDGEVNQQTGMPPLVPLENDQTSVIFYISETVYPNDANLPGDLVCFNECPDPSALGTDSPHLPQSSWEAGDQSFENLAQQVPYTGLKAGEHYAPYSFDSTSMLLQYDNGTDFVDVVMGSDVQSDFGLWTGALIPNTTEFLKQLACDWDPEQTCPWQAYDHLNEYYTWETGPNSWNHLSLLLDKNLNGVEFEPPLMVEYAHATGTKYFLDYAGRGELHGFPGICVDMDTGKEADCAGGEEKRSIRWVPELSIPDGSTVTDASSGEAYYVKGLDKEQRMQATDSSDCTKAGLKLTDYPLPDDSAFESPNIGDEPKIDSAPAVIGGVLQGT